MVYKRRLAAILDDLRGNVPYPQNIDPSRSMTTRVMRSHRCALQCSELKGSLRARLALPFVRPYLSTPPGAPAGLHFGRPGRAQVMV